MSRRTPAPPEDHQLLSGLVERVTYHNEDTGFAVLRVQPRGRRDLVTVVGHVAAITPGELIQASGTWVNDKTHGLQFQSTHLHVAAPTSAEGVERYLGSGLVRGVGPHFARRLVEAFSSRVFDVIEQEPDRLRDVPGIGPVRAARIVESWREQRAVRDIMVFLHSHQVSTARAVRIFKTYGANAIALISEDPYRLARDVRGIGFLSADRIAASLGIDKTAITRLRAGVRHVLAGALDAGHCGLPREETLRLAVDLLGAPVPAVEEAVAIEVADGGVVRDAVDGRDCLFLAGLYAAEQAIAARLAGLVAGEPPWPRIDADRALPWVEQRLGVELASGQREALRLAVSRRAVVVTGGPGVGKTTLVRAIVRVLTAKGARAALCAPTGRAARRLTEATGLEAKTIHRLLEVDPRTGGFRRDERRPLEADVVIVDETSMVDTLLFHSLTRALASHAALILVGDVDQLPSVGPGQVLADVIDSARVPVVRLTEVFRQAAESRIITAAHRINRGQLPDLAGGDRASDFHFITAEPDETGVKLLLALVTERLPRRFGLDPIRDIQVLCPMNRGSLGARSLNLELQRALNGRAEPRIERFGWTFAPGDKVMQIENDYDKDVYNGDIGRVATVDLDAREITVDFEGRRIVYDFGELDRVVLAYATTIHKAQGSEYPAVVVPLTTQHYPMLKRNLVYTAVTRGKRLVVLVGQTRALALAVKGQQVRRRWSKLREFLTAPA